MIHGIGMRFTDSRQRIFPSRLAIASDRVQREVGITIYSNQPAAQLVTANQFDVSYLFGQMPGPNLDAVFSGAAQIGVTAGGLFQRQQIGAIFGIFRTFGADQGAIAW